MVDSNLNNDEFQEFLAKETNIDINIIKLYFEEDSNSFNIAEKIINEENFPSVRLGEIYGSYLHFAYVDPNSALINEEFVDMLGSQFIKQYNTLPLCKFGKAITVATSDPLNPFLQDKLEKRLDSIVSLVFCFPFDIKYYMDTHSLK